MEYNFIDLLAGLIIGAVFGGIGALLGRNRKIGAGWAFALSFFFTFIGWIIVLCSKRNKMEFIDMSQNGEK